MTGNILFVDNERDFLDTRAEFLERVGYTIIKAYTLSEAAWLLKNARLHAAIIDVRMQNEDDERDISGLTLLDEPACRSIPVLILTGYPSVDAAVRVLRPDNEGKSLAIDFVKKEDGPEALIERINRAFAHPRFRINWSLAIDWKAADTFSLVKKIEPNLESERLLNRAEEFEDLFRHLFYEKDYLRIQRLLWQRNGRVALVVFSFKEGMKPESHVVVCGHNGIVNEEARRFGEYSPIEHGDTGTFLSEKMKAETIHFAANAYTLAGNDLEKVQTLADLYSLGPEKVFSAALNSLYLETLRSWHQEKPIRGKGILTNALYGDRLRLADLDVQHLEEQISAVESRIPTLDARISRLSGTFSVHFKSQTFAHPDPIPILSQIVEAVQSDLFITVPGMLSGDNILVDSTGHTWLTDFYEAGLAPMLWNYVTMEAVIRFDWLEMREIQRRYELERCLVYTDFAKPDIRDLEPVLRKPARAIQVIRKLAARTVGKDVLAYQQGLLLHAARRLADFNPAHPVTATELARLGQVLFSMAMIAEILGQSNPDGALVVPSRPDRIRILDDKGRIVMVGNRRERLTPQTFALFKYLYDKANQICSKDELLKEALQDEYDEGYLHTLVGRIRKTIEDDPEKPRFLITEPNAGYRLIPKPK